MTALEAADVVPVNVSIVIQVAITQGAAFCPEHRFTSSVIWSLFDSIKADTA